jgi:hypothetical protein
MDEYPMTLKDLIECRNERISDHDSVLILAAFRDILGFITSEGASELDFGVGDAHLDIGPNGLICVRVC